ncbi:MAG: hypothetical protein KC776_31855 [Myxococcales bacterium]|nr:hypothetical protein [Myxococcales bacterium]
MKRRVLLLALVLAVSACDEKKTAPAAPKASAATVAAPAASSAAPPEKKLPWFVGHFSGAYDAQHYLIEMSKSDGVVRNWAEDDGGAGSGEGTISLDVTEDGTIVGSSKGPLGELVASGEVDETSFRVRLVPKEPGDGKFTGFFLVKQDGKVLRGRLQASTGDSLTVRDAPVLVQKGDTPPDIEDSDKPVKPVKPAPSASAAAPE